MGHVGKQNVNIISVYKQNRAAYATQWAMPESRILTCHWFYKHSRDGDASGIHAIAMGHVGKINVHIPLVLYVKQ